MKNLHFIVTNRELRQESPNYTHYHIRHISGIFETFSRQLFANMFRGRARRQARWSWPSRRSATTSRCSRRTTARTSATTWPSSWAPRGTCSWARRWRCGTTRSSATPSSSSPPSCSGRSTAPSSTATPRSRTCASASVRVHFCLLALGQSERRQF